MSLSTPSWRDLYRKEIREILRDRRTIITLILMPLLLYPLLSIAFQGFFVTSLKVDQKPEYRLGFRSQEEFAEFDWFVRLGKAELAQRTRILNEQTIEPNLKVFELTDSEAALQEGSVHVVVVRESPPRTSAEPILPTRWELRTLEGSYLGKEAATYLRTVFDAAVSAVLRGEIEKRSGREIPTPILVRTTKVVDPENRSAFSLTTVIPLILILMTITGAVYPAIDLTAGERERGTLELLMAAPVSRTALLVAKYLAVFTVASLTALANFSMMALTVLVSGLGSVLFGTGGLNIGLIAAIFLLVLLFASFFSAVLLTVAGFARSFKEAQAYLIPLMLVAIAPGILSLLPGVKLSGLLTVTPLVNIVLLTRDILEGTATIVPTLGVIASTLFFTASAIALAARIFGGGSGLYAESGGWSDWLRRPALPQDHPPLSSALLCLAIVFPLLFLATGGLARLTDAPPIARQLLGTLVNLLLFLGVPLGAAYLGNVRAVSGFALRMPSLTSVIAAIAFGCALWPIVAGLTDGLRTVLGSDLPPELAEQVRKLVEAWRRTPLPLLLVTIAVIPAVVEELMFRGWLFGALRPHGVRFAVLGSAIAFGLFHVLLGGVPSFQRVVVSTLLGIVLAFLRERSGSVFAGMILHIIHNTVLVTAAVAPEMLGLSGEAVSAADLPAIWWGIAGVGVVIGVISSLRTSPISPSNSE